MKLYTPAEVTVADSQREKLNSQIDRKYLPVKLVVKGEAEPTHTLLLTRGQIAKIKKARDLGQRRFKTIRMSRMQIEKNRKYLGEGVLILDNIPSKTGMVRPVENDDEGIYLVKAGHTMKVIPLLEDMGLHLVEHSLPLHETFKDGLYQKEGNMIKEAETIFLTQDNPKIPILQWLL